MVIQKISSKKFSVIPDARLAQYLVDSKIKVN